MNKNWFSSSFHRSNEQKSRYTADFQGQKKQNLSNMRKNSELLQLPFAPDSNTKEDTMHKIENHRR